MLHNSLRVRSAKGNLDRAIDQFFEHGGEVGAGGRGAVEGVGGQALAADDAGSDDEVDDGPGFDEEAMDVCCSPDPAQKSRNLC